MQKLALLLLIIIAFSCKKENGFQIDTKIEGISNGTIATLKTRTGNIIKVIDSTTVENGKFSFKGTIEEPIMFGIFIDSTKSGIFPFIDVNDKISIEAYKDSLHFSKITGSKLNNELLTMRKEREAIESKGKPLMDDYITAKSKKDTIAMQNIRKKMGEIGDESLNSEWNYLKTHPNSFLVPIIFEDIMANPKFKDSVRIVFESFSQEIQNSKLAKKSRDYLIYLESNKKKFKPVSPK